MALVVELGADENADKTTTGLTHRMMASARRYQF
jgi:hypothetical protein